MFDLYTPNVGMENRVSTPTHKPKRACLLLVCPLNKVFKNHFKGKSEKNSDLLCFGHKKAKPIDFALHFQI